MGLSKIDSKLLAVRGPGGSVVEVEARVRHSAPSGEGVLYVGDRYKCSLPEALVLSGRGVVRIVDEEGGREEVATPSVVIETKESAPDSVESEAPDSPELPSVADSKDATQKPKRGRPRKVR